MEIEGMKWIWIIAGTLAFVAGGFYFPGLRVIMMAGFRAILSEAVMQRVAIMLLESLVKSTKNKLDDLWLAELKKRLNWDANPKAD